jgi:hypothetical protein
LRSRRLIPHLTVGTATASRRGSCASSARTWGRSNTRRCAR